MEKPNIRQIIENFQQSHSAKNLKRDTLCFFDIHFVSKYHRNIREYPLETLNKKFSEKNSHCAEKLKGETL